MPPVERRFRRRAPAAGRPRSHIRDPWPRSSITRARRVQRSAPRSLVSALLVGACLMGGLGMNTLEPARVRGAEPSPSIVGSGDTRSEGEGAGLVGSPIGVALGVVILGVLTWGAAVVYVRLRRDVP